MPQTCKSLTLEKSLGKEDPCEHGATLGHGVLSCCCVSDAAKLLHLH